MNVGKNNAAKIRVLNDQFRQNIPGNTSVSRRVMLTSGILALTDTEAEPGIHLQSLFERIRLFDDFSEDNDPYGEHDFGSLDFKGEKVFWKIDHYAPDMKHGAENPADAINTVRVLTIMLAEEY